MIAILCKELCEIVESLLKSSIEIKEVWFKFRGCTFCLTIFDHKKGKANLHFRTAKDAFGKEGYSIKINKSWENNEFEPRIKILVKQIYCYLNYGELNLEENYEKDTSSQPNT